MTDGLVFDSGNADQFRKKLAKHEPAFLRAARAGLEDLTENWTTAVRKRFTGYYFGRNKTKGRLRNSTGDLKSSIGGHVTGQDTNNMAAVLRAGTNDSRKYALLQEEGTRGAGGTLPDITPTNGQYMTIPTRNALTPAGALADPAKLVKRGKSWHTKSMGPTFIHRFGGTPVIFAKRSENSKAIPIYTLRKKVAVRPRLGAHSTFVDQQDKVMERLVDKFIIIAEGGGT